jgi:predicted ribosome quality control (RQC) complex YloA/Tae2 family protein
VIELWPELVGRRVQRIDMPDAGLLCLTLAPPKEVLVVGLDPRRRAVALDRERPRGAPASAFVLLLRKWLGGGRLGSVARLAPGVIGLTVERQDGPRQLVLELTGTGNVLLFADGRLRGALDPKTAGERLEDGTYRPAARGRDVELPANVEALRARAESFRTETADDALIEARAMLVRALERHDRRLDRRLRAIEGDRQRVDEVEPLRTRGSLLLAHLHAYTPGAPTLEVIDWTTEPPTRTPLPVDPARGAKGEAEALFRRARKLERGAKMAEERARATETERAAIRALVVESRDATTLETLGAIAGRATRLGVAGAGSSDPTLGRRPPRANRKEGHKSGRKGEGRRPYRTFFTAGGHRVFVGRGAADNDRLTTSARPSDLWLHARSRRGAHVIVPLDKNGSCPNEVLVDAATLAAHFSEAAGEPIVEVQYTPRRYVRKPRGTAQGAVLVEREKVLAVRMEPARVRRLIATEERD